MKIDPSPSLLEETVFNTLGKVLPDIFESKARRVRGERDEASHRKSLPSRREQDRVDRQKDRDDETLYDTEDKINNYEENELRKIADDYQNDFREIEQKIRNIKDITADDLWDAQIDALKIFKAKYQKLKSVSENTPRENLPEKTQQALLAFDEGLAILESAKMEKSGNALRENFTKVASVLVENTELFRAEGAETKFRIVKTQPESFVKKVIEQANTDTAKQKAR